MIGQDIKTKCSKSKNHGKPEKCRSVTHINKDCYLIICARDVE